MIETKIFHQNPLIILHKILAFSDEQATIIGVRNAVKVVENALIDRKSFDLLIDLSETVDESNYKLSAHKIWAEGFKENAAIKDRIRKTAVVANDSPKFRTEKEYMEDRTHKWFTDFQMALDWLKSHDN